MSASGCLIGNHLKYETLSNQQTNRATGHGLRFFGTCLQDFIAHLVIDVFFHINQKIIIPR